MRDGGREHFEEVILQLELFALYEMSNALRDNHGMLLILKDNVLFFECHYLLIINHGGFINGVASLNIISCGRRRIFAKEQ